MADIGKIKKQIAETDDLAVAIPIYDRQGEPHLAAGGSQATISVLGSESAEYKRRKAKADRAMARGGRNVPLDEQRRMWAACGVEAWHGWEDDSGRPLECTNENVKALLTLDYILHQVEAGIRRDGDFFASASRDSSPTSAMSPV